MEFKLDQIIAHLAIYLVIIVALKKLYIDPAISLLKRRESLTSGRKQSSIDLAEKLEEMKSKYSESWETAKSELEVRRQRVLKDVREDVEKKIASAKKDNERKLNDHQLVLNQELKSLEKQVPQISAELAKNIVDGVLSAKVVRL